MSNLPPYARAKLPKYAQGASGELIKALCKGACGRVTIHELQRDAQPVQNADERFAGCTAKCLRCGKIALDNYNWFGI